MKPDPALSLFRFSHLVEVRYADCDMLQHVNNARYFSFMEVARVWYYHGVLNWRGDTNTLATILAHAECDFRQPLVLGDTARVYIRTARIGTKSYDFEYAITRDSDGVVAAVGRTVQVMYDYQQNQSIPVPAAWRETLAAYEQTPIA